MAQLTVNETPSGLTHCFTFDYQDLKTSGWLSTIGAANQRQVGNMRAGAVITDAILFEVTAAAGATDLTIDFGTTGADPDELLDNGDVDGITKHLYNTGDALQQSTTGATLPIKGYANNSTSDLPLYMEFNGTVSSLTAGEWKLVWITLDPTDI